MEKIQLDRLRGIAVGAVVGDALGMPLEFHPARPIYELVTEMAAGPLPAGSFTDDTEMSLALAESLLNHLPLDAGDLVQRFCDWYQSNPSDVGIHISQVLQQVIQGVPWQEASHSVQEMDPESAANGSLMRAWPLSIVHWRHPEVLIEEARLQSEVTHTHPDCVSGCIFLNLLLAELVRQSDPMPSDGALRTAIATAANQAQFSEDFHLVIDLAAVRSRERLANTGWVRHTLEASLWALLTTRSFEEALVQAVNLGNDADTTGAVTGAIAGALYGLMGIPQRWKDAIHGEFPLRTGRIWFCKDIIHLADQLSALDALE